MYDPIRVDRGRTTTIRVSTGIDLSGDVLSSQIRVSEDPESTLLATWDVDFVSDGVDGELVLTLDNSQTSSIEVTNGYMDIKRLSNGEPLSVFDNPIPVVFKGVVTA